MLRAAVVIAMAGGCLVTDKILWVVATPGTACRCTSPVIRYVARR